jgi:hypothetical protein
MIPRFTPLAIDYRPSAIMSFRMQPPRQHFTTPPADDQLTVEQCEALAQSFRDLPPEYQLTAEELQMWEEELHGRPMRHGDPTSAVYAMKRRLALLRAQKAQALDTMDIASEAACEQLAQDCRDLDQMIIKVKLQLDDYLRQQGSAN